MPEKALIIGCGYIGLPLALQMQTRGIEVHPWVRSDASAHGLENFGFARIIHGSVADEGAWSRVETPYDLVIHCASSGGGGEAGYTEVFREGMRLAIAHQPAARKVFISSTSVYGQTGGEVVTEKSLAEPATVTGKILREAEEIARQAGVIVVRSSGIYGPNRAGRWEKFQNGEAVMAGDGSRWTNQIHQLDLILAIAHLVEAGEPGEIYNATDDTPVTEHDFYAWCAEFLQKSLPPSGPADPPRKRGLTNKRVSNAKLRATGWAPIYPSFSEWFRYSPK